MPAALAQPSLDFDAPPRALPPGPYRFGGETYAAALDEERLGEQLRRVWRCVRGGEWLTLAEIAAVTGDPEASVSARLRQLRGMGFEVERRRRGDDRRGLWEYRVEVAR